MANITLFDLFGFFELYHFILHLPAFTMDDLISCIYDTSWVIVDLYLVAIVVICSELVSREAGETKKMLHYIENQIGDVEVVKKVSFCNFYFKFILNKFLFKIQNFCLQINHRSPIITSSGLFVYDWTLIFTVKYDIFYN